MSVEFYLARRYLMDRQHGAWGWLISSIAVGSVALGVAALIVTLSVMTGFREDIQQKMLGINPHIFLNSFTGELDPSAAIFETTLKKNPDVAAWSPFIFGQILIGKGKQSSGATIKGIDPEKEPLVSNVGASLIEGNWEDLKNIYGGKPGIILGRELARQIGARVGDIIWVLTPNSIEVTSLSIPKVHLFEVKGLMRSGLYDYDTILAYTDIPAAQNLFNLQNKVTGMGIRTNHLNRVEEITIDLRNQFNGRFWVRSWLSQNKNLFSALKLERAVMFLILAMVTVVAAFMIVSNLLLIISHKTKEIGILRAMGATQSIIRKTFLYQGLIMGLVGNGIGVTLGIAVSTLLAKTNIIRLPADVYYIDHLPIRIVPGDILTVVSVTVVILFLASFFPASRAAKLDPLDAIRYG